MESILFNFQLSSSTIFQYFHSNYGEIVRVSVHTIPECRVAIVSFKHEEHAIAASQRKQHIIAGSIVHVSIADEIREQTTLLSLNDDCFLEIFKQLELKDLCAISNVCLRLRGLAQTDFSSKYKDKVFTLRESDDEIVADCLRNFGSQIQSLQLKRLKFRPSYVLHLVSKYCDSLIRLELYWYVFYLHRDSTTMWWIPLFTRLKTLILEHCRISGTLFSIFDVPELILRDVMITKRNAGERQFTRLKTLKIFGGQWDSSPTLYLKLIKQPKTLEYVEIEIPLQYGDYECAPPDMYKEISKYKNLKTLRIYERNRIDVEKAIGMVERLGYLSELILGRPNYFTLDDLWNLIVNGNNLEQLIVIFDGSTKVVNRVNRYDENQFPEMANIVSQRTNGKPLNVIIVGYEHQMYPFLNTLPPEAPLKINYLLSKTITLILTGWYGRNTDIKMSNEQIEILRDNGMSL